MSPARYEVRGERGFLDAGWLQARFSFSFGNYVHPRGGRFGPVLALNEDLVQPATGFPMHPHRDLEIFMLPRRGAIAHEDSLGGREIVRVGQALMMRAGHGIRHSQFNASGTEVDHHLQLWIEPARHGLAPHAALKDLGPLRFGKWQRLAAPQGEVAPFTVAQQARVFLGAASASEPLVLSLREGEAAYPHVIEGACTAYLRAGRTPGLAGGDALAVESLAGTSLLRPEGDRSEFLLVTFPASLLLRNRTSAEVRAGR